MQTDNEKVYAMRFSKRYPMLVSKAVNKGRTQREVDELAKGKPMENILRTLENGAFI